MPMWSHNWCKNAPENMQTMVAKKVRGIIEKHVFLKCKNRLLIGSYSKFEVLQGDSANGKSSTNHRK